MSNIPVLRNIPELMGQPAGIAALASLGIHGAIALILPLVPVNTAKSNKQEGNPPAVGITTLTPQEQARLPQTTLANPQKTNTTVIQPQAGVANQLPPVPDGSAATPLPPLPVFPTDSQPLPPLPNATNVNVPKLPRGQRVPTGDFSLNTGFRANPLTRPNYSTVAGNRKIGNMVVSRMPTGTDVSVPDSTPGNPQNPGSPRVIDPPLSSPLPEGVPEGMAPQNGNVNTNNNPSVVNNADREFITPTGEPLRAGGEFSLANQEIPGVRPLPDNSLTQKIATVLENNQKQQHSPTSSRGDSSEPDSESPRVTKALLMAQHYQQAQQNHGQLQTKQPLKLTLDRDGLKEIVDVGLVVKADGTIDDFKIFTNDGKQLSFEDKNVIRKFLADYLGKNPPANAGKPVYLTANIAPGSTGEKPAVNANGVTIPTKPSTDNVVNDTSRNSNNTEQKPRSLEIIRPNTNNNNPNPVQVSPQRATTRTTTKPQLESEPSFSEPIRLRTPRPVTIPTQQPTPNPLLETTPQSINQPSGESQKPARISSWRERLTPQKTNSDDDNQENSNQSSGIRKLRELAEIKNQLNP